MHIGLGGLLLIGLLAVLLFGSRQVLIRLAWIVGILIALVIMALVVVTHSHAAPVSRAARDCTQPAQRDAACRITEALANRPWGPWSTRTRTPKQLRLD